ncbi:heparan-alpha-glucosaminide N-acetyltransferase [Methylocystis sp. ATCC 49242]|uniref:heparan-alpha-glucosaminide N-acetyltransferase n=1 Tax=Methylocystis sp. ATCC 49242 TaxID=622637 RepID=UPI0001F879C8|nr:heparan-alpha-glucosaminide N-acetyltransferase [Methylocystis sp. ATCC 49242]
MSARPRWGALDAARGLAVVAMVVFHLIWDLGHFGHIAASIPWSAPVKAFGHAIAFSFLFIAGVSLVLANEDHMRWPAFWRRFAIIAGAAALVSAGTYAIFPAAFVFFGILHCIAAASLVALPFLRGPWLLAAAAGAFFFAAPHVLASPAFNSNWLQWLGLSTTEPLTQDWRPLFPWAGALLLGVAAAKALPLPVPAGGREDRLPRASAALKFLGRHSLLIYLAHQPILFAVFSMLAFFSPAPDETADFVAACETSCRADGAGQQYCHDACLCTAQEALRTKALAGAADDAERGRRLNAIARRCMGNGKK